MKLSKRQSNIVSIISKNGPIKATDILKKIDCAEPTLRSELSILGTVGVIIGKPNYGYVIDELYNDLSNYKKYSKQAIKKFMNNGVSISSDTSVYDATLEMIKNDVSTLFVSGLENELVGLLSRKDLLKAAILGDAKETPVELVMTRQPLYKVDKCDEIEKVIKLIVEKEIDSVPVVEIKDGKDFLIGRMTKTNITKIFLDIIK